MSMGAPHSPLSADDRYELAARAAGNERSSKPTHLVVLGGIVLFVGIIAMFMGWRANASARSDLDNQVWQATRINGLIAQVRSLEEAAAQSTGDDPYAPIPDLLTQITLTGQEAGLENPLSLPESEPPRIEGSARLLTYPYTVRDSSLARILAWIELATERISGLEVRRLNIAPGQQLWTVNVTLARYERIE